MACITRLCCKIQNVNPNGKEIYVVLVVEHDFYSGGHGPFFFIAEVMVLFIAEDMTRSTI